MSGMHQQPRYVPVSYDHSQRYPMADIDYDAHKQQYSTRTADLRPSSTASLLSSGGSKPTYHVSENNSPSWISKLIRDWWTLEILAWVVALGSMAVMVYFLKMYDQKPQSDWPFPITVNAFLQIFTTTLRGAILVPVAQSISQLKWTWFLRSNRPLEDFATFEEASRGIWGSLCLIWHQKAARLASLGALITIMTLATSTFVQQAVTFPIRSTVTGNGTAIAIYSTFYHDLQGIFDMTAEEAVPMAAVKGAFYSGLLQEHGNKIQPVVPTCSTGNCTWPLYSSLAICPAVSNVTTNLKESGGGGSIAFTLSNGDRLFQSTDNAKLNITDDLRAEAKSATAVYNRSSIAFSDVQNPLADFSVIFYDYSKNVAVECLLELCVQTFNTSVTNGVADTTVVDHQTAASLGITFPLSTDFDMKLYIREPSPNYTLTMPTSAGSVNYTMAAATMLALQIWIGKVIPGYSTRWNRASSDSVDPFITAMDGVFVDGKFVDGDYMGKTGSLMDNIATAMTNNIRSSAGSSNHNGTAYENITYIHIEWKWLYFPIGLLILSFVFLTATIIKSHFSAVGIWKGSTLATMQVLTEETRRELGPLSTNSRITKSAEARDVRLRNVGGGWGM
ncbi:hypothetical protein VTL71DRAFT_4979 [Oculimacula yallundae]|uniref:Uncharacterized protein n=1 Tax=Oculimacula yallundae TaxID=86028 RepID=A0ABR4C3H8_9HELO